MISDLRTEFQVTDLRRRERLAAAAAPRVAPGGTKLDATPREERRSQAGGHRGFVRALWSTQRAARPSSS
jgi:hypothetical protein